MEITLKFTKKRVLACVAVLGAVGLLAGFAGPGGGMGGGGMGGGGGNGSSSGTIRTTTLEKMDLASTVSATGTVYSASTTEVYSTLSYTVDQVLVEVGDVVQAGDVLAKLETDSLTSEIAQKQASLSSSYAKAQQSLVEARQDLENYKRDTESGLDTTLMSAENSVQSAEVSVQTAELDLQTATQELRTARQNYNDALRGEGDYADEDASDEKLRQLRDTQTSKETALEKAQSNLDQAYVNLDQAKANLESAKIGSTDSLKSYENKVKTAELNLDMTESNLSIQNLQQDLEKCTITAPVSGTVTAVNVVEGASGSGQLFVIQNEEALRIVTYIKEYDIDTVSIGDRVVIKTDATGDDEFEGNLTKIAPTSTITATGEVSSSTDSEFEAEVTVSTGAERLRIGMNARLSIITEEHADVFAVPFEAVETVMGQSVIYVADRQDDGSYVAQAIPVTQGLETDLYIEVESPDLTEGMIVIRSASNVTEGQVLDIQVNEAPGGNRPGGMPEGMEGEPPEGTKDPDGTERGERPEGGRPDSPEQENDDTAGNDSPADNELLDETDTGEAE